MKKNKTIGVLATVVLMSVMIGMTVNAVQATDPSPSIVIQNTYYFTLGWPDSWSTYSVLNDDVYGSTTGTGYADKFVMTLLDWSYVEVEVVDCCLMGDTIALGKSAKKYWSATSPATVFVSGWLGPGTYVFYVGYILPHTWVFPAGYDIYVWTS